MSLQLSEKFSLPKLAALWTYAILAIKGAGKTYDAAKMAEQMIKLGIPIVVLDPMGIWWGLRVGITPAIGAPTNGLPVVIFGGDHADLPIPTRPDAKKRFQIVDEDKMRQMVLAILQNGLSVVLDTSQLSITQQTRTVGIFADELYRRNGPYGVRHVFIEEADVFCPQKPMGEKAFSQGAIDNLVRRGGNFNLGCTMITQRAAVLNKDALSQATCLIAMRTQFVRDKDAIKDWVKSAVKDEKELRKLAKWYDSLKELKNGEAWIYSPEHDIFEKVQFGERETLHASREYFLQETWEQKNITLANVNEFVEKFKQRLAPKKQSIAPLLDSRIPPGDFPSIAQPKLPPDTLLNSPIPAAVSGAGPSWGNEPKSEVYKTQDPNPGSDYASQQTLPDIHVTVSRPVLDYRQVLPAIRTGELDEPRDTIGRLAVILKTIDQKNAFGKGKMRQILDAHSWDAPDLDAAVDQLVKWEILKHDGQGHYRVDKSRLVFQ
jgi:hypothetical protein